MYIGYEELCEWYNVLEDKVEAVPWYQPIKRRELIAKAKQVMDFILVVERRMRQEMCDDAYDEMQDYSDDYQSGHENN